MKQAALDADVRSRHVVDRWEAAPGRPNRPDFGVVGKRGAALAAGVPGAACCVELNARN